ncbi:MAG: bifunctional phosphopantothenoylcysteine decarboxylase/phosphopantothenate--cysteine ligase CoaBC [Actinomycetota bacterium]|nr:bifunctional phosphopantothenoylcysteine decarboxylase/phosphopantothenate--cysteine ligase CoaBC [Actinomycetota bacterium]MEC9058242.1 bifunctional phosphopantothenoylcysteine decarboxylase/phosphopantothenate--cysteine ligase CoaBC [Actinomycetota bacterium]MEC9473389.1 bifunctional phosphopantothenoylcysteine decarboxylase/phosphopantothenate--cysteine ligase CoaBC [Actinomycetota bacterium]MEE3256318.1 bifunctional phosphopantothenoylcysteine decarboxylase/phosphopantothenate--cysteine l
MLGGRRIVLGVTGGIAAYKAVLLCRLLVDAGAHVIPVMTESAQKFVGRATFDALASEPVRTSIFDDVDPIPHTTLGQTADLIVVAPATARCIGSYASGISDDLLTAILVATRAPVVVCPAMHTEMWEHPAIQENLKTLVDRGVIVVPAEEGRLAGGDAGAGRLAAPETIFDAVKGVLTAGDLQGRKVLVTAGGTREAIDPVRYVGNRSTGKQGYAVAEAALARGADVTLISTVTMETSAGIEVVAVESARQMHEAVLERAEADVIVMAAAVADFRPTDISDSKIKKNEGLPEVLLEETADILTDLGGAKRPGQVIVGFAAETDDLIAHAKQKLERKNIDVIVANDVSAPRVGFAHETNEVTILEADGCQRHVSLRSKRQIADEVLNTVIQILAR